MDYLRGLCAAGIMAYHYAVFGGHIFQAQDFMQRIGIYGVSIFYILSGLTLYSVYRNKDFTDKTCIRTFFIKRAARIYPLFVSVTLLVYFGGRHSDTAGLLLNITGLFSLLDWPHYFIVGGWSIGNELFFYLMFPLIMAALGRGQTFFYAIWVLCFLCYLYFPLYAIRADGIPANNWHHYVNPLNQVFLFVSGIALARWGSRIRLGAALWAALGLLAVSVFCLFPLHGNPVVLMTFNGRMVFTAASLLLVWAVFKWPLPTPKWLHLPLYTLGEISYAVYLLHPVVYHILYKFIWNQHNTILIIAAAILTLIFSYCSFHYFEKFFIDKARL